MDVIMVHLRNGTKSNLQFVNLLQIDSIMNFLKSTWSRFFNNQVEKGENKQTENAPIYQKQEQEEEIPEDILQELFILSADCIKQSKNVTNDQLRLRIYALYKQATQGDCNTKQPGLFDLVGKSKWSTWNQLKGMSRKNAKLEYVKTVGEADPQIVKAIFSKFQEESKVEQGISSLPQVNTGRVKQPLGLCLVQQVDYSSSYSHPYFKIIEKGEKLPEIKHEYLLKKNNQPEVYPLHFAIQKERLDLVKQFLKLLTVQEILEMKDAQGTGVLQYAELMENDEILQQVKVKLGESDN